MDSLPKHIRQMIRIVQCLPVKEQRERHLEMIKDLVEIEPIDRIHAIRKDCFTCPVCQWLGREHLENVINMIDGHLALREMGLVVQLTTLDHLSQNRHRTNGGSLS